MNRKKLFAILNKAFTIIDRTIKNTKINLRNAREFFESGLNNTFKNNARGWTKAQLKNLTTKIGSGATPRGGKRSYKTSGTSLVRSMNVHDLEFSKKGLVYIDDVQSEKLKNVILERGDVLLNITGDVARSCIVEETILPARVNQHVSIIRSENTLMDSEFLNYLLVSKLNKDRLLSIGEQGLTRQAITKRQLEGFEILYPRILDEQKRMAKTLAHSRVLSEKIIGKYQRKLSNLAELKESLLQQAFNGELTKMHN